MSLPNYDYRLKLPDDWNPSEVWCVQVTIPAGQGYIDNLTAMLNELTFSRNFFRDPTMNGAAQVSRTWQRVLNEHFILIDRTECMAFDQRVKAGAPWITEVSTDGGATWHDAIIQPHWGDSATVAPPINNQSDADAFSAALLRQLWEYIAGLIRDGIGASTPKATTIATITGALAPYGAGAAFSDAVSHAWDTMNAMSSGERDDWATDCQYSSMYDDLRTFANDNPYTWLNSLADWLFQHLDDWAGTLMHDLNAAAAALGGNAAWNFTANQGGAGGGAGFGSDCTWSHTFDFSTGEHGWTIQGNPSGGASPCTTGYEGVYEAGVGYQPILDATVSGTSDTRYRVCPQITFPARTITALDFEFSGTATFIALFTDPCTYTGENLAEVTSPETMTITPAEYTSLMPMFCQAGDTNRLTKITVHGIGFDPF